MNTKYFLKDFGVVSKIPKNNPEGVINVNHELLQTSFLMLICGKPGCGKSNLIRNFIQNEKLYFRKFDFIFIISPNKIQGLTDDSLD